MWKFLIPLILAISINSAFSQEFGWVQRISARPDLPGPTGEIWQDQFLITELVATDPEGNILVVGKVRDSTQVDVGDDENLFIARRGIFVIKYNEKGDVIWKRDIGGNSPSTTNITRVLGIAVDNRGDFWLSGDSYDTLTIFKGVSKTIELRSKDDYQVGFLVKYDKEGELLFGHSMGLYGTRGTDLVTDKSGNLYITGYCGSSGIQLDEDTFLDPSDRATNIFTAKYSRSGDLEWAKTITTFNVNTNTHRSHIVIDALENIYVSGGFGQKGYFYKEGDKGEFEYLGLDTPYASGYFLTQYSNDGNLNWTKNIGPKPIQDPVFLNYKYGHITDLASDVSGNGIYFAGYCPLEGIFEIDTLQAIEISANQAFIAKADREGKILWVRGVEQNHASGGKIVTNSVNDIYLQGNFKGSAIFNKGLPQEYKLTSSQEKYIRPYIAKFDSQGEFYWATNVEGDLGVYNGDISIKDDKIFLTGELDNEGIFGETKLSPVEGLIDYVGYLTILKDEGYNYTINSIRGNISQDVDGLCSNNGAAMSGIVVKAEPGPYFASTDSLGNYTIFVDKGTYTVEQIIPSSIKGLEYQQICPGVSYIHTVSFEDYGNDTAEFDFINKVSKRPILTVNVAADRRRRCFTSTTSVEYCNDGYAKAENLMVDVYYPEFVVPISANIPWIKNGDILTFNVGNLSPGTCGTIYIADSVICGNESIRGLTQCVKAVINPYNTPVAVDPAWDLSDVTLKSICRENGIIQLTIKNSGSGNMVDSSSYRILLDAVEVFKGEYILQSGDSLTLQVPANGRTLRLEVDLPIGHPDKGRVPNISLEGCGTSASGDISTGFVSLLPADDTQAEVSFSCLPILDSYDPNDKQVMPAGVGPERIIAEGQELEYLIRFQNTGTDVAYNVSIEDILSENLDISTLKIGAASHPFTWSVSGLGQPTVSWKFVNINLPDSSTNEPESHGFVRFKIKQKQENSIGTVIENKAAIYFDFNSPIVTNVVSNKVGILPLETSYQVQVDICSGNYPTSAEAGDPIRLDEVSSVSLRGNTPLKGAGYWRIIKGNGKIEDPTKADTKITDLGVGKNTFEWSITLCDSTSTSQVMVERVVIPPQPMVDVIEPYCYGDPLLPVRAWGNDVSWYSDNQFEAKLHSGQEYLPSLSTYEHLYVCQTVDGYSSEPLLINIKIKPEVKIPEVPKQVYICNGQLINSLIAQGQNIHWYSDAAATKLLQVGEEFNLSDLIPMDIFVTQTIDGCTSPIRKVSIIEGFQDLKKNAFVPNVITPNGDGKNDNFSQPTFKANTCIGEFLSIHIYNKWGNTIFSSADPAYSWNAQGFPNGLYYYDIQYDNLTLKGQLTVLF